MITLGRGISLQSIARKIDEEQNQHGSEDTVTVIVEDGCFLNVDVIALLFAWCLDQVGAGKQINIDGAHDPVQYLARMNFHKHLGISEPAFTRHTEVGRFIPIRLIRSHDDVHETVNAISDLVLHQFDRAPEFIPAMEWAVNEIIDNIVIHSETKIPGVVCAQYYPGRHGLDIAVYDMGLGIKATIGTTHNADTHRAAISKSIERGITRDSNIGQGNGLAGTVEIAIQNKGYLNLWSGDSVFRVASGDPQDFLTIPTLPGTGIKLCLNTENPVDLSKTWIGAPTWSYIDSAAEQVKEEGGIDVASQCVSTGGRPPAAALRRFAIGLLSEMEEPLVLDFSSVKSASSSFLDELLGRMIIELGDTEFKNKIKLVGMSSTIRGMANVVIAQRLEKDDNDEKKNDKPVSNKQTNTNTQRNAWIISADHAHTDDLSISIALKTTSAESVREGDFLVLVGERSSNYEVSAFARVFRSHTSIKEVTFYFDGIIPVDPGVECSKLSISQNQIKTEISRMDWPAFESALKTACSIEPSEFPTLKGESSGEKTYIRDLLQLAVEDDLLGPANGPFEEIIGMSVRDRYLVGKLAPKSLGPAGEIEETTEVTEASEAEEKPYEGHHQPGGEFPSASGDDETDEVETEESDASKNQSLVPSSMGFTFCVDASVESIELNASWGRYERTESERINEKNEKPFRCWKRIPSGGTTILSLKERVIKPIVIDKDCPEVFIRGSVGAPLENGDRLITLFLVNDQLKPDQLQDIAWLFQPELLVRDQKNKPIFQRRPIMQSTGSDAEREALEMIYRHHVEFAVGHGVSVHAITSPEDSRRAVEVRTHVLPQFEVPVTETPGLAETDRPVMKNIVAEGLMDMKLLAKMEKPELVKTLNIVIADYSEWIGEQRNRIEKELSEFKDVAIEAMDRCDKILTRLREGISVLESDEKALEAFRFANMAMADQRIYGEYALQIRRGETAKIEDIDVTKNRSWRPFQLAFFLLSIPSLSNPEHKDRTETLRANADLLWFPTGGGKTEAYLGVAAFTMGIRRLQGKLGDMDGSRGLAVIMRYTLRLLTQQQFQRASTLICAMELIRRKEPSKWGSESFTIGLWIGRGTPYSTEQSHKAIEEIRDKGFTRAASPAQLTSCPWCGTEIRPGRDIFVDQAMKRTVIYCGDKLGKCEFSKSKAKDIGIPVLVVDDEIYRRPPSMLIATVDKFAMMAWRGQIRTLFGITNSECPRHGLLWPDSECNGNHQRSASLPTTKPRNIIPLRPPDLIIQDEFHLISGPLGTMVGLYETAVDELCSWKSGDKVIRPKVIASTATVRKAQEQIRDVFLRRVAVFPPHGLDVEDNFFSVQRPIENKSGRRYVGICSPGSSRPAVLIRVYVALLTASQCLFERFGLAADPYMSVVGYFNSLRELGGMRRLAEDDVQTRSYRVQMSDVTRPGLSQRSIKNVDELTSRVSGKDVPKKLDTLEVKYKAVWNSQNTRYEAKWDKNETQAVDIVLATNMLSVGVDINRLGLMVVNGQPKNTAEYIQSTSRVGRFFPGLICTVLTWSRPRDLSHYESFEHYHATFYKHVEAQSVTPFSPRAMDRGLTGTMVSLLRLGNDDLNPNLGAQELKDTTRCELLSVRTLFNDRAGILKDKNAGKLAEDMVKQRIHQWNKEAIRSGRRIGYEVRKGKKGQGDVVQLLRKPGVGNQSLFSVPMSMREVEPGVTLVMDAATLTVDNEWRIKTKKDDGGKNE